MKIRNVAGERFQLLSTFKAIYTHGSIYAAANVQGVTQSAASKHLQKLRDWFDDELFVRTSKGMQPTAKAITLIERVEHILQEMDALHKESLFDPLNIDGVFTIATTSEVIQRLTPSLLKQLAIRAPKLRITLINLRQDYSIHELESGKVDVVISVNWHAPEQLIQKRLFTDRFVCLMNKAHPLAKGELDLDGYVCTSHLLVAPLGKYKGFIDEQLLEQGLARHVRLSVPDFSQLSPHLLDDEHIVTLPEQIALTMQSQGDLVIKPLPLQVPNVDYYLFWHRRFQNENVNTWMRTVISDIMLVQS